MAEQGTGAGQPYLKAQINGSYFYTRQGDIALLSHDARERQLPHI